MPAEYIPALLEQINTGQLSRQEQKRCLLLKEAIFSYNWEKVISLANLCIDTSANNNIKLICCHILMHFFLTAIGSDSGLEDITLKDYYAPDLAMSYAEKAKEIDPSNLITIQKYAETLIHKFRFSEALQMLEDAAKNISPDHPDINYIYCTLAIMYYSSGDFERAKKYFTSSLDQYIQSVRNYEYVSRILMNQGKYEEARNFIYEASKITPITLALSNRIAPTMLRINELERKRCPKTDNTIYPEYSEAESYTVCCVKYGDKYGAEYVNILNGMIKRNLSRKYKFICFTDNSSGINKEVECRPLPAPHLQGWWTKLGLFNKERSGLSGKVLYIDLDTVITGNIDKLFDLPVNKLMLIEHPMEPHFNSSVIIFYPEQNTDIWNKFDIAAMYLMKGDQDWIEYARPDADVFPRGMINMARNIAHDATLEDLKNNKTKIVTFPKVPKPHQLTDISWVRDCWYE